MRNTKDMVLAVMPEGPIAFDGQHYRYSKGERLYLDNLASHFKELVLVTFVFRQGDPDYETCIHSRFMAPNLRVIELPAKGGLRRNVLGKALQFLKIFFLLVRIVPRFDLLYLFLPSYPSALGWMAGRLHRKRHIVYGADDWVQASETMFKWDSLRGTSFYRLYAWLNRTMERAIVRSAAFCVAAGGQLREKYKSMGVPTYDTTPRMTLTPDDIFERDDTCQGDTVTLINVGALVPDKAQHLLLAAVAPLIKTDTRLRLQIVGGGPKDEELKALAVNLGIADRVQFLGYIEAEEELYGLLRHADMFVLSSVTEGFPRVLYESMAMRLPIVATACGGIPHLMKNDENAKVVPVGDVPALTAAVAALIEDGPLRRALIKQAARTMDGVFQRMDPAQIAKLVETHL
ncbi:hypothetical protein ASD04_12690 [Devosia sp. Root436]|jgi:glycosyltransferase involved in cell wall biosynthesis|uniref:glycosyltransferase n=1 Tax=Devosia sp. Root436 TaxID=1736537 RepID=UPI000701D5B5|nr:glycosyltransferase [Devosia sp. Root436]KQX35642.1 hypothetical protein ASD04_12690 [Devosia sp. Root436]